MVAILLFRICLLLIFFIALLKMGDWKNWQKFYPTVLFVMVANLLASFLTYHHILWNYNPDLLVKTQTTVELINSFFILPASTFIYLSEFPITHTKIYQYGYIAFWIFLYTILEFIDHYIISGISYKNGWSCPISFLFDIAMFSVIRIHYLNPILAWKISLFMTGVIIIVFNFVSGEFK